MSHWKKVEVIQFSPDGGKVWEWCVTEFLSYEISQNMTVDKQHSWRHNKGYICHYYLGLDEYVGSGLSEALTLKDAKKTCEEHFHQLCVTLNHKLLKLHKSRRYTQEFLYTIT